jgi:asparagine synthase (glutamine-hydrolysing)
MVATTVFVSGADGYIGFWICHRDDALSVIPSLPSMYCEPFADSSQIPTYLVSRLASEHVKVSLSGDAGDELFAGYNRYLMAMSLWARVRRLPGWARKSMAKAFLSRSPSEWDRAFRVVARVLPRRLRLTTAGEKAHKLAGALRAEDGSAFYRHLVSHFDDPASVVLDGTEPPTTLSEPDAWPQTKSLVDWMMAMDFLTYMTDDILTKVDRAAVANSLETRVPYLDHRVIEFAWRLPMALKVRDGKGKWITRQILDRYIPPQMLDRPKMGSANPLHEWLRGSLRDWAEALLDRSRLASEGFFNPQPIRDMWDAHLSGRSNEQHSLWVVLMFRAWLAEQ